MDESPLLLFDLGGVLVENSTFESLRRLLPAPLDGAAIRNRWMASPAVRRNETGMLSPEEFARAFIAEWGLRLSPEAFLKEFYSWPSALYPQARETIRALRKRHPVACFSNCSILHWEKFSSFTDEFDLALSSHLLGAIKPDEEAFVRAFARCRVEPADVCFFDDTPANVEAARRLGARAFHVEGIGPLLRTLRSEGFLPG